MKCLGFKGIGRNGLLPSSLGGGVPFLLQQHLPQRNARLGVVWLLAQGRAQAGFRFLAAPDFREDLP